MLKYFKWAKRKKIKIKKELGISNVAILNYVPAEVIFEADSDYHELCGVFYCTTIHEIGRGLLEFVWESKLDFGGVALYEMLLIENFVKFRDLRIALRE